MSRTASPPSETHDRRVVITTEGVAARDRFEWWRCQFGPLHTVEVTAGAREGFVARGVHTRFGSLLFARYATPARRVSRTAADIRRDDVDHLLLRGDADGRGHLAHRRARRPLRAGRDHPHHHRRELPRRLRRR